LSKYPKLLSKIQNDIMIGSMLGDGCVRQKNSQAATHRHRQCARFRLKMKLASVEYVNYIAHALSPFSRNVSFTKSRKPKREGNKVYSSNEWVEQCYFHTINHPIFARFRNKWYEGSHKIVPPNIKINNRILANWFCQDGSNEQNQRRISLWTLSFSDDDAYLLASKLNYSGIRCDVYKNRNKPFIRSKGQESYFEFMSRIKPYIVCNCMNYKQEISTALLPDKQRRNR
jgi:hypothetical protein